MTEIKGKNELYLLIYFLFSPSPLLFPAAKSFIFFLPPADLFRSAQNVLTAEPHNPMWTREWMGGTGKCMH